MISEIHFLRYPFLLISLFNCYCCFAQLQNNLQNNIPVFRRVSYPFLPSITAPSFFFTQDGLMWFSSARGLTSFDGTEAVYHCSLQEANELGLNKINTIAEDKQRNLFISTSYKVIFFNRKEKKFYSLEKLFSAFETQSGIRINSMKVDKAGIVYMGSYSRGMFIYYPAKKKVEHFNLDAGKPETWVSSMENTIKCFADHATDSTKLWVGTFNGIYLFDEKTKILSKNFIVTTPQYNELGVETPYYDIGKMDVADDSTIWLNMRSGGFCSYNTHTGNVVIYGQADYSIKGKPTPSHTIASFAKFSQGKYLLGIHSGKSGVFDAKTKTIAFFDITSNPNTLDAVTFCEKDKQGNIWLLSTGLLYVSIPEYSRIQHVTIPSQNVRLRSEMRGVYYDKLTHLYYLAVRFSSGIYVLDTNFKIVRIIPGNSSANGYTDKTSGTDKITKDGSGRFWTTGWKTYVLLPGQEKFDSLGRVFPHLNWINNKGQFFEVLTPNGGDILLRGDKQNCGWVLLTAFICLMKKLKY